MKKLFLLICLILGINSFSQSHVRLFFNDSGDTVLQINDNGIIADGLFKSSTVIVASSTTTRGLLKADYQCDGTDDQAEINQAINSLPSSGGTVLLLEGYYSISAEIELDNVDSVNLMGSGTSTFIEAGSLFADNSGMIDINLSNNIRVSNLSLSGNTVAGTPYAFYGIDIDSCSYVRIDNITAKNYQDDCIASSWSDNVIISNNFVGGLEAGSPASDASGIEVEDGQTNTIIYGNICEGRENGIHVHAHPSITGAKDILIYGNFCYGQTGGVESGIGVTGVPTISLRNISIVGNFIKDVPNGILLVYADSCVIQSNFILNATTSYNVNTGTVNNILISKTDDGVQFEYLGDFSILKDDGIVAFGTSSSSTYGETYFGSGSALNFNYNTNANSSGWVNFRGYQNGQSQFRDFIIGDGKADTIAWFDGSAKYSYFHGNVDIRSTSGLVTFGTSGSAAFGETYLASGVAINFGYGTNANSGGFINFRGYQNSDTQFRDLTISDGKGGVVGFFDGSLSSVGIGLNAFGAGADKNVSISNGAAGATTANQASFYVLTGEMWVKDGGGTATQISPHASDAPEWMYDKDDLMPPQIDKETNDFDGIVRYTNNTRKNKLLQMLINGEELPEERRFIFTETYFQHEVRTGEKLIMDDWDDYQERELQKSLVLIEKYNYDKALFDAEKYIANQEVIPFNRVFTQKKPKKYIKKQRKHKKK